MEKNLSNDEAIKKMKELAESVGICIYTALSMMTSSSMAALWAPPKSRTTAPFWFFTSDYSGAAHLAASQNGRAARLFQPGEEYLRHREWQRRAQLR